MSLTSTNRIQKYQRGKDQNGYKSNLMLNSDFIKYDPFSSMKTLCINYFVDQKIGWLQEINAVSFIRLMAANA